MKIVLVVTNTKRKSLVFVSDELNTYSLEEAIQLTRKGKLEGAHTVQRGKDAYIRTNPSVAKSEEFDSLSVTIGNILLYAQGLHLTKIVHQPLSVFIELYLSHLKMNEPRIEPVEQPEVLLSSVKKKLQQHRSIIFEAAEKFSLDPYLIGAILIDEIARLHPFEAIKDIFGAQIIGGNTSVGIAQVKTDTANNIIQQGLYNPNPNDPKLPFKKLDRTARSHLYTYLIEPKHSIFFAAANVKSIINFWAAKIDLSKRPEIITTLYHQGQGVPKTNPVPNDRGKQIASQFYSLAKKILKKA